MRSLRTAVSVGTVGAVAVALGAAGWSVHALVEASLLDEFDRALVSQAELLATLVEQEGEQLHIQLEEVDAGAFGAPERGQFFQLGLTDGRSLYLSPSLGGEALDLGPPGDPPTAAWVDLPGGARGRALVLGFLPRFDEDEVVEPRRLTLGLAREAEGLVASLATLRGVLLGVGLATLAAATLAVLLVARRALRPVDAFAARLEAVDEEALGTQLDDEGVPEELLPVVRRVNGLLARLDRAFARERSFSSDVAHELRVPLAGLRATLEVAATRPRSQAEYTEALASSAAIAEQLHALVERLLQLARFDRNGSSHSAPPYDLAELVLQAWEPYAERAAARGLHVDLELPDGATVASNPEIVSVVLRNLFDNAVSYCDAGGRIAIRLDAGGGEVSVEVTNTGSALDDRAAGHATERFWRGDDARTEAGLHCGLGLALTQRATRALGGRLELRSEKGGEFRAAARFPAA